jgi:hypothetical protein
MKPGVGTVAKALAQGTVKRREDIVLLNGCLTAFAVVAMALPTPVNEDRRRYGSTGLSAGSRRPPKDDAAGFFECIKVGLT